MPRAQPNSKAADKKLPPVKTRKIRESEDQPNAKAEPRNLPADGQARLDPPVLAQVDRPVSQSKLEALAFNEDVLTVMVHDSANPVDDPVPAVWVDGISQYFIRGKEQQVKRKFVEALARQKVTTYTQQRLPDNAGYKNIPHITLKYPFAIIHDPSPKGADWFRMVRSQA